MLWEYRLPFQYWLFHCAMTEWWYSATWFITMFSARALLVSVCLWNLFHHTLSAWEGEEGDFSFDGLPGAQHEFKVEVPGNQEECFVQKVAENAELHASFEVRFRYKNMHKRTFTAKLYTVHMILFKTIFLSTWNVADISIFNTRTGECKHSIEIFYIVYTNLYYSQWFYFQRLFYGFCTEKSDMLLLMSL